MTPPTNRLLAVFVSEGDLGRIMQHKKPKLQRYMLLQVERKLESANVSNAQFQQLSTYIRQQQDALLNDVKDKVAGWVDSATGKISEESGLSLKMKIGEAIPLGIFLDKSHAIGFAILAKVKSEIEGKKLDYVMAGSTLYLLINSRLIYAYVFSKYKTQDDLDWVRSKSKDWVELLLTSNSASNPGFTYKSVSATAIDY